MRAGPTVLAVFAHPDDESLACGGTLARLADLGIHVVVVSGSRGELGIPRGSTDRDCAEMRSRVRVQEMRAAAGMLGVREIIVLDHLDSGLRWLQMAELRAEIITFLRTYAPVGIVTFGSDGLYWHEDHIGIYEHTTAAVLALGADAPPLYYVTMPVGAMPQIVGAARARGWAPPAGGFWSLTPEAFGCAAKPATLEVDVAAWLPRKLAALSCYGTQLGMENPFALLHDDEAQRWLGIEYFRRADLPSRNDRLLENLCTQTS